MKARITAIESGASYTDGHKRVTLKFEGASGFGDLKVPIVALDLMPPPSLDDVLEVEFMKVPRAVTT